MNRKLIIKISKALIVIVFFVLFIQASPPHPNNGNSPGEGNSVVGGLLPLGGGTMTLLALGALYGVKKILRRDKSDKES